MNSVNFLSNYWESLVGIRQEGKPDTKGKLPVYKRCRPVPVAHEMSLQWEAPGAGRIKVNVDGAFSDRGESSFGVVVRDENAEVRLSAWGVLHNASSAEEVELMACREGLKLVERWAPQPAILESDCLTAINLLSKPGAQMSPSTFIIKETVEIARRLPAVSFNHVKREKNSVAHELAQPMHVSPPHAE